MPEQGVVLDDLIMKFRVDEGSMQESLAKERQLAVERGLILQSQKAAFQDLKAVEDAVRAESLRSLQSVEDLTLRHYANRGAAAKENTDEVRRLEEALNNDLANIARRRAEILAPRPAPQEPPAPEAPPYDPARLMSAARQTPVRGLEGLVEANRESALKNLDLVEDALRKHYENRRRMAQGNSEELLKIEAQAARDMARVATERRAVEAGEAPDGTHGPSAGGAVGQILSMGRQMLSAFGLPLFAGLSLVGFMTEMSNALNRMRAMEAASTGIARGAGQFDMSYSRAVGAGLRALTLETGRPFNDLSRVAGMYAGILPGGDQLGAANTAADLTRQTVGLSTTYAVPEQTVAKIIRMFNALEHVPLDQAAQRFKDVADRALALGTPVEEFMQNLIGLTELNRRYGASVENNVGMLALFSHELHTGIITIQDLNRLQFGLARADEGTRAFYVGQALERGLIGGEAGDILSRVAANPAALEYVAAGMIEDKDNNRRANEIRKGVTLLARDIAETFATGADSPQVRDAVINKFTDQILMSMGFFGQDMPQNQRRMMEDTLLGERRPSRGPISAGTPPGTLEAAVTEGVKIMHDSQTWQTEVKTRLEMIYESIVMGFDKQLHPEFYKRGQPGYEAEVQYTAGQIQGLMRLSAGDTTRAESMRSMLETRARRDIEGFIDVLERMGYQVPMPDPQSVTRSSRGRSYIDPFAYDQAVKRAAMETIDKIVIEVRDGTKNGTDIRVPSAGGSRPANVEKKVTGH